MAQYVLETLIQTICELGYPRLRKYGWVLRPPGGLCLAGLMDGNPGFNSSGFRVVVFHNLVLWMVYLPTE